MVDVKDNSIVITGGAEGIGYSIAEQFLKNGAKLVIIIDINEEKGLKAVEVLNREHGADRAVFIKCDIVKDLDETFRLIVQKYEVDVLVNNAGVADERSLRRTMEVNCIALVELSIKFFHRMRADRGGKGGTIINIASLCAVLVDPCLVYYKTSKYAVLGFSKCLGHEDNHRWSRVRVICILPSFTRTQMPEQETQWDTSSMDFKKFSRKFVWQSSEDVGNGVIDVFRKADSGTAWIISGGDPPFEAPPIVKLTADDLQSPEIFSLKF